MTNEIKFKTAEKRIEEFEKFCDKFTCDICPLGGIAVKSNVKSECSFKWLALEYGEELKNCPFCGSEARIFNGTEDHYVLCRNSACTAALVARSFSSPEEAIAAWNKRAK